MCGDGRLPQGMSSAARPCSWVIAYSCDSSLACWGAAQAAASAPAGKASPCRAFVDTPAVVSWRSPMFGIHCPAVVPIRIGLLKTRIVGKDIEHFFSIASNFLEFAKRDVTDKGKTSAIGFLEKGKIRSAERQLMGENCQRQGHEQLLHGGIGQLRLLRRCQFHMRRAQPEIARSVRSRELDVQQHSNCVLETAQAWVGGRYSHSKYRPRRRKIRNTPATSRRPSQTRRQRLRLAESFASSSLFYDVQNGIVDASAKIKH